MRQISRRRRQEGEWATNFAEEIRDEWFLLRKHDTHNNSSSFTLPTFVPRSEKRARAAEMSRVRNDPPSPIKPSGFFVSKMGSYDRIFAETCTTNDFILSNIENSCSNFNNILLEVADIPYFQLNSRSIQKYLGPVTLYLVEKR